MVCRWNDRRRQGEKARYGERRKNVTSGRKNSLLIQPTSFLLITLVTAVCLPWTNVSRKSFLTISWTRKTVWPKNWLFILPSLICCLARQPWVLLPPSILQMARLNAMVARFLPPHDSNSFPPAPNPFVSSEAMRRLSIKTARSPLPSTPWQLFVSPRTFFRRKKLMV